MNGGHQGKSGATGGVDSLRIIYKCNEWITRPVFCVCLFWGQMEVLVDVPK